MVSSILAAAAAADLTSATATRRVERGELVRLTRGIYSTDVDTPPERIVRQKWHTIVGRLYPDAVITDRSAITGGPVHEDLCGSNDQGYAPAHFAGGESIPSGGGGGGCAPDDPASDYGEGATPDAVFPC